MRRLISLASLCALLIAPVAMSAEIAVVVNRDSPVQTLNQRQVSDLFLGRARALASGEGVVLFEQPSQSPLREEFYRMLNGMGLKQLNAYWARLQFSGEVLPPASLPDSRAVLDAVRRQRNAIGYVDAALADGTVRVVLRLKERMTE